jgi:murein DD-endopeptidase MepM/ murein hydrolase activator NlpD
MLISRRPRAVVVLLVFALVAVVPLSASAQTESDVEDAEEHVEDAQAATRRALDRWRVAQDELEAALLELDDVTSQLEHLNYTIGLLERKIGAYNDQVDQLRDTARDLVVEAYTTGGRGLVNQAFEAGSIQDLLTSQVLMDNAASRDIADLDRLRSVSREMNRLTDDLAEQRIAVEALEAEIADLVARTSDLAEQARAAYDNANAAERAAIDNLAKERREFKAAEARRAAAAARAAASSGGGSGGGGGGSGGLPPDATPGFRCPVQGGAAFANTWGAPRSGGRRHKGVDMFNARNTPLVAVVDGTVRFSSNSLGGLSTHVYSDDGVTYYYAHLESHPTNISSGQRVSAGTIVGYLGNSGNARYTSPHVHFEIRPGGRAVNPYPTVRHYC